MQTRYAYALYKKKHALKAQISVIDLYSVESTESFPVTGFTCCVFEAGFNNRTQQN